MKYCPKCQTSKPESEYHKRGLYLLMGYCKICQRAYSQEVRQRNRALIRETVQQLKKGKPCEDCGEIHPYWAMEYDHVRGTKLFNIGDAGRNNLKLDTVLAEIEKCDLVCATCHRYRTHGQRRNPP